MDITIPNNWKPRHYQKKVWHAITHDKKRICLLAHRRYGKDDLFLHGACVWALERPASYWHMLPQATQARKAIWEAVNPHTGIRRIDEAFPQAIRKTTREQEMMIKFINGSTWQVVGSDNYNSLVGSPPYGVVFSEYSLANPNAWAYIKPILTENKGKAAFIYTPRGKNHGYQLYKMAESDPDWYCEKATVDDTGIFSKEDMQRDLESYQAEFGEDAGRAFWLQEYYASFDAALPGAYYVGELAKAEQENRITELTYDSSIPVNTTWDIGRNDYTAIWFTQKIGSQIRFIDYYQNHMQGIEHYAQILKSKGYFYNEHVLPHDAGHIQIGSHKGQSVKQQLEGLLPREYFSIQKVSRSETSDIYLTKGMFNRFVFDREKCKIGLDALGSFAQDYSEKYKVFTGAPAKSEFKHGADAFRYAAVYYKNESDIEVKTQDGQTFNDLLKSMQGNKFNSHRI